MARPLSSTNDIKHKPEIDERKFIDISSSSGPESSDSENDEGGLSNHVPHAEDSDSDDDGDDSEDETKLEQAASQTSPRQSEAPPPPGRDPVLLRLLNDRNRKYEINHPSILSQGDQTCLSRLLS